MSDFYGIRNFITPLCNRASEARILGYLYFKLKLIMVMMMLLLLLLMMMM